MSEKYNKSIFWYRRDLRLKDNAGLYHALKKSEELVAVFIFDSVILKDLQNKKDARVSFIHQEVEKIKLELQEMGSDLRVYYGKPEDVWETVVDELEPNAVFTNRDYEPYAKDRDTQVSDLLKERNIEFLSFKDHVIFEVSEVLKDDGDPYVVFTPFKRKWLEKLNSKGNAKDSYYFKSYPTERYFSAFAKIKGEKMIQLSDMGFEPSEQDIPSKEVSQKTIKEYDAKRNFPAIDGTSKLGIHFRFGTISIREKARKAIVLNETYLSELVWRDFYSTILDSFPHVVENSFREKYDAIQWRNNEKEFKAWCEGKTGYPIVDAGMRELNATGYMHSRVRMVTASFLTKHLLIDWRWGESYFAEKLLDYDLASNNGGWQWAAGSGTDAAPYFRIFNPESQQQKFDKDKKYIKQWVSEYGSKDYPDPIVDHKSARERCLKVYKEALN